MQRTYRIELDSVDLGQLLDGLEMRAESWERTAKYLRAPRRPAGDTFLVEECSEPEEAESIAQHYRSIIAKVREQMETQS